ncbi:MAG: exosortase/archaeosortase family protein [Chthoniobacterales bacterium]
MTGTATISSAERTSVPWLPLLFAGFWTWAIWSCAEHWRGNPNYSYGWAVPVLALGFGLRRYLLTPLRTESPGRADFHFARAGGIVLALIGGATVCALEFSRQQMWHSQIVLVLICALAIAASLSIFCYCGGYNLARAELFPVLFFLTAVPWPARIEQPITSTLMRWVAAATAELLHWLGVEAQTSGGAIALRSGLVGITEACSGVRSLQAGIMFGLALGEWFLLRPARRVLLLGLAIILALATNLARTLALSLQAEWHGLAAVENVHDLVGNITITSLIVAIWLTGKLLAPRQGQDPWRELGQRWQVFRRGLLVRREPAFAFLVIASVAGLVCARMLYGSIESRDHTQTAPFFAAQASEIAGDQFVPVPREIWNELRPTSGEYLRRHDQSLPRGVADFYHFFWKPSPWNRFALVHRPDICMPGVGWELSGAPTAMEIEFNGRPVRFHAFRFHRGPYHALQMWGVWRNGEALSLDYSAAQALGAAAPPSTLQIEGKRHSATEIAACSLFSEQNEPSAEMAVALLRSVFQYKPQ